MSYFTLHTSGLAAIYYADKFSVKFEDINRHCADNPDFELEMVCAYLENLNGFSAPFPKINKRDLR
jgi:hypothetical protein